MGGGGETQPEKEGERAGFAHRIKVGVKACGVLWRTAGEGEKKENR